MRTAIDTNVLARFLTWDDEGQARSALAVIESADAVIVSTIVLCEAVWVLSRVLKFPRQQIAEVLREFVTSDRVEVNRLDVEAGPMQLALGGDFADGVIRLHAEQARADRLVTFDQEFAATSRSPLVQLIPSD